MAALAVPVLRGAATALLRALGVGAATGVGVGVVNEAAKKKAESAERAKASSIAQAGSQTKTQDTCSKCPPDCGTLVARNWNMSDDARTYQARITGFAPRTEWSFGGTDFDGFKSQACLLLEAKAKYDQFFVSGQQLKFFFNITGRVKMMRQANTQSAVIDASPPSQLHWHFMQPLSHAYFTQAFRAAFLPIITVLTP